MRRNHSDATDPARLPDPWQARPLGGGVGRGAGGRLSRVRRQPDDGDRLHPPHGPPGAASRAPAGCELSDWPPGAAIHSSAVQPPGADRPHTYTEETSTMTTTDDATTQPAAPPSRRRTRRSTSTPSGSTARTRRPRLGGDALLRELTAMADNRIAE